MDHTVYCLICNTAKNKGVDSIKQDFFLFSVLFSPVQNIVASHHFLCAFFPVSVVVSHVHQFVLQLLNGPHLGPLPFPSHLNGWLAHNCSTLNTQCMRNSGEFSRKLTWLRKVRHKPAFSVPKKVPNGSVPSEHNVGFVPESRFYYLLDSVNSD